MAIPKRHAALLARVLLDEEVDFRRLTQLVRLDPAMCVYVLHCVSLGDKAPARAFRLQSALASLGRVKLWQMLNHLPVLEEHCADERRVAHFRQLRHAAILSAHLSLEWAAQQRKAQLDEIYLSALLRNMGTLLDLQEGVVTLVADEKTMVSRQVELRFSEAWGLPTWLRAHLDKGSAHSDALALSDRLSRAAVREWGGRGFRESCQAAAVLLKQPLAKVMQATEKTARLAVAADGCCPAHHAQHFQAPSAPRQATTARPPAKATPQQRPPAAPSAAPRPRAAAVAAHSMRGDEGRFFSHIKAMQQAAVSSTGAVGVLKHLGEAVFQCGGFTRMGLLMWDAKAQIWRSVQHRVVQAQLRFDATPVPAHEAPLLQAVVQREQCLCFDEAQQARLLGQLPALLFGMPWAKDIALMPLRMGPQQLVLVADNAALAQPLSADQKQKFMRLGHVARQLLKVAADASRGGRSSDTRALGAHVSPIALRAEAIAPKRPQAPAFVGVVPPSLA